MVHFVMSFWSTKSHCVARPWTLSFAQMLEKKAEIISKQFQHCFNIVSTIFTFIFPLPSLNLLKQYKQRRPAGNGLRLVTFWSYQFLPDTSWPTAESQPCAMMQCATCRGRSSQSRQQGSWLPVVSNTIRRQLLFPKTLALSWLWASKVFTWGVLLAFPWPGWPMWESDRVQILGPRSSSVSFLFDLCYSFLNKY